jgi:hypothetical protein
VGRVCRRDVRIQLKSGDFIVWFCARTDSNTKTVNYYFVGCTTVAETIDRITLWTDPKYRDYRDFYNTLARPDGGVLVQHEIIHPFHADWARRATAPYILFDNDDSLSAVNLSNPTLVATKNVGNWQETWLSSSDQKVATLEDALFNSLCITRRLRTSHPRQPHRQIRLHHAPVMTDQDRSERLEKLRETILPLV